MSEQATRTFMCLICGWIYDEAAGVPDEGIAPGTRWEDVPMNWSPTHRRMLCAALLSLVPWALQGAASAQTLQVGAGTGTSPDGRHTNLHCCVKRAEYSAFHAVGSLTWEYRLPSNPAQRVPQQEQPAH